jgi:hypothetical protein
MQREKCSGNAQVAYGIPPSESVKWLATSRTCILGSRMAYLDLDVSFSWLLCLGKPVNWWVIQRTARR